MELEAKIADLDFSARLYFLRKFLFSDFFIFREIAAGKSRRVSWTIKMEAMTLGRLDFSQLVVFGADRCDPAQGSTENTRNERFRSKAFQQKKELVKNIVWASRTMRPKLATHYVSWTFIEFQSGFWDFPYKTLASYRTYIFLSDLKMPYLQKYETNFKNVECFGKLAMPTLYANVF